MNPENQVASLTKKYCPQCGAVMYQGTVDGYPAWICPDTEFCGYYEVIAGLIAADNPVV